MNSFGIFNGEGLNSIIEIPSKFNSKNYITLLKEEVLPAIREKYPQPQIVYFVQDQCPIHMAKGFMVIQLPPKGSDMNPIENIWGVVSRRMNVDPEWD